jgi:hypothetical protein
MKRYILIGLITIAIVTVILFYPGKFPYSLEVVGKILPLKEWVVIQGRNGLLTAVLRDNSLGKFDSYYVTEIERGDPIRFNIHQSVAPGHYITKGDTIGWIDSNEIERQLVQLNRELQAQKGLLRIASTGEKESMVLEARRVLDHARETYDEHQKIVARLEKLSGSGFVPFQEYEIALNTQNLFMINIKIAEAQLQSVQTGLKQEEIDMIASQIENLEEEIGVLRVRLDKYVLISPLSGMVFETLPGDTLINIGDISSYTVIIPLKLKSSACVGLQQQVKFSIEGSNSAFDGKITKLGNVVHILNGEQVILATAHLDTQSNNILNGSLIRCSIICDQLTLREHIIRSVVTVIK